MHTGGQHCSPIGKPVRICCCVMHEEGIDSAPLDGSETGACCYEAFSLFSLIRLRKNHVLRSVFATGQAKKCAEANAEAICSPLLRCLVIFKLHNASCWKSRPRSKEAPLEYSTDQRYALFFFLIDARH